MFISVEYLVLGSLVVSAVVVYDLIKVNKRLDELNEMVKMALFGLDEVLDIVAELEDAKDQEDE